VLRAVYNNSTLSQTLANTFNGLVAAAYFTTFATSVITTTLIAYRIYACTSQTGLSRERYRHILDIVIQSGAVYSLTALATAISGVLPGGSNIMDTRSISAQNYIQALSVYVSVRFPFMRRSCSIELIITSGLVGNHHGSSCWPSLC
jgi:hypothetical protein